MVSPPKGLARGVQSLLGATPTVSASRGGGTLPISLMQPGPFQPRREIHQQPLEELAASIKANGVIEPIIVRAVQAGTAVNTARYEIVAGERRWRAAKLAGLTDIPTIVRQVSDRQAVAIALVENIQREELTAAEQARALKRLIEEFALTHQEVADAVGRSRPAVSNLIRLLELPESVVALIDTKVLSMGHARALLGLDEDTERERLAQLIVQGALSVRATEKLVANTSKVQHAAGATPAPPRLTLISEAFRTPSARVELQQKAGGAARIVIDVADETTCDAVLDALRERLQ